MTETIYGYFEGDESIPTFDPGLEVNCPICHKQLSNPIMSISLMFPGDDRSWFYRVHSNCWESLTREQQNEIDSLLIDPLSHIKFDRN